MDGRVVDCCVSGGLGGFGKGQDFFEFVSDGGEGVFDESEGFVDVGGSAGLGTFDDGVLGGCENFGEVDGDVGVVVVGVDGEVFFFALVVVILVSSWRSCSVCVSWRAWMALIAVWWAALMAVIGVVREGACGGGSCVVESWGWLGVRLG